MDVARNRIGGFGRILTKFTARAIGGLPAGARQWLTSGVGRMLFVVWRSRRRLAIYWAARALGVPVGDREARRVARRSFVNFGRFCMDFVASSRLAAHEHVHRLVAVRNGAAIDQIAAGDGGCLFLTGHIGNWEILGSWLATRAGPTRRLRVVALPLEVDCFDDIAHGIRQRHGFDAVSTVGGAREVLRSLRAGDWVAALVDRPVPAINERVEFLGRVGPYPVGIARLAGRARVPIVMGACWETGRSVYEAEIWAPFKLTHNSDGGDISRKVAANLEAMVRRHPDQWYIAFTSG